MFLRTLLAALGAWVLIGCAADTAAPPLPADHPANPSAVESPQPLRSETLSASQVNAPFAARAMPAGVSTRSTTTQSSQAYTCPMHPQVISDHPGNCPICGMKLVAKTQDQDNHHDKPGGQP